MKNRLPALSSEEGKLALLWMLLGVGLRLLPHPDNFTPLSALAIFGGAYLGKRYALLLPLLAWIVSDLVIGPDPTFPFTWGSILIAGLLGLWARRRRNYATLVGVGILNSALFFLISNFGVWLVGGLYSHTAEGLIQCYTLAIPFYRNTLLGDLVYLSLLVGTFEGTFRFLKPIRSADQT